MGSNNVNCHLTQLTAPCLKPSQTGRLDLPTTKGWKAELTLVLVYLRDGLPFTYQSSNHLIATRLEVKPTTSRWRVQHPTITKPQVNKSTHHTSIPDLASCCCLQTVRSVTPLDSTRCCRASLPAPDRKDAPSDTSTL